MKNTSTLSEHSINFLKERMTVHRYDSHAFVYYEGDPSEYFYYMVSGKVRLVKQNDEGKQMAVDWYMPGDLFGPMDIYEESPHPYSAEVLFPSEIGFISRKDLETSLVNDKQLSMDLLKWMSVVHRITHTKLRDLMLFGKTGALCSVLIRLTNTHGVKREDGTLISVKLTHNELGELIGATRESVNRLISELKNQEVIDVIDGMILVRDLQLLKDLCHCEECQSNICRL
jgi:CRP/FNR family transcriptional regulator, cyclic AMP receptor protein